MKKILFILPSLKGGGAERVTRIILTHLDRVKFDPHLLLLTEKECDCPSLVPDIDTCRLGSRKVSFSLIRLISRVWRIRPDIVYSTLGYVNLLIMLAKPFMPRQTRFIARESNIPSIHLRQSRIAALYEFLYRRLYPRFDALICQSKDMRADLLEHYGLAAEQAYLINNPVDTDFIEQRAAETTVGFPDGYFHLLAVGKLMPQKGFDILLRGMRDLGEGFFLTILGRGEEETRLRELAREFGIEKRVAFKGYVDNPYPYMKGADLFILTSRYEGFPNVVLEANACGTPVVAFDCPGDLREIIQEGINGWLVPPGNVAALVESVRHACSCNHSPSRIKKQIREKYGVEKIMPTFEQLLLRI